MWDCLGPIYMPVCSVFNDLYVSAYVSHSAGLYVTTKYIYSLAATDCVQTIYASSICSCLCVVVDVASEGLCARKKHTTRDHLMYAKDHMCLRQD